MDELVASVAKTLLEYGLSGIVIMGLCVVIYFQRKDLSEQRDELKALYEARRQDSLAGQSVVRDNTEAILKIKDAQERATREIIGEIRDGRYVRKPVGDTTSV